MSADVMKRPILCVIAQGPGRVITTACSFAGPPGAVQTLPSSRGGVSWGHQNTERYFLVEQCHLRVGERTGSIPALFPLGAYKLHAEAPEGWEPRARRLMLSEPGRPCAVEEADRRTRHHPDLGWPGKIRAQAGGEGLQPPAEHLLEEGGTPLSGAFLLLAAAGETGKAHPSNFPVQ